jgi:MerR family transcriptional regulator/heat shock protein HspR
MVRADDAAVYVISVAAELGGVHPQTLRLYERRGLLDPARSAGGNRRYSERDLARLHRIGELTSAGVNLEGVRRILELEDELSGLRAELARTRAEATEAVARTHGQYRGEPERYQAPLTGDGGVGPRRDERTHSDGGGAAGDAPSRRRIS